MIGALWLIAVTTYARTMEEAMQVASQFISHKDQAPTLRLQRAAAADAINQPVELAFTQYKQDNTPAVYVFNSTEDGFVLISAEDQSRAILGYSDQGVIDANNIPENLQFWLQMYADEMRREGEWRKANGENGKKTIQRKAKTEDTSYPTIDPIMTTTWGQGVPYNNKCPKVNGKSSVTGCVATAIGQIMCTHKYPTMGIGSHSYTTESKKLKVSADFGATTYDWANMLPHYRDGYTDIQADAVATLLHHVGVAADMDYTPDGSGTISSTALAGLAEYFGYDRAINVQMKDYIKEEVILQSIASDLQAGLPVYISGVTVNREGHAFVCDGMHSDGYLHINWGWDGIADGYFVLSALDPENQGTGGSSSDLAFTESVTIYSNIKPDAGGQAMPLVIVNKLTRTSADTIGKNAELIFSLEEFTSTGIANAEGTVTYFIYKNQELVEKVGADTFELATGYYYSSPITLSQTLPSSLAEGDYELEIRYVDSIGTDHPILVKGLGEVRIPFAVTSSQFIFGEIPEAEIILRDISKADITNVYGTSQWEIDLYSSNFWNNTPSEQEVLLRFTLNSSSLTSAIGTYVLDPTNPGAEGTINAEALYAVGYYGACYQYVPSDIHLTIMLDDNNQVMIEFYAVVNRKETKHSFLPKELNWYTHDLSSDRYYYYHDYVTYELAASLKASRAIEITQALKHTNPTEMAYFVDGTISYMRNTPEEIAQYKSARFDISDDGTTNNQFYCYNTKWLKNNDFVTGSEIKIGDKVVVLGKLQNYAGNTAEIKGYVYDHVETTVTSEQHVAIDNMHIVYDLMGRKYSTTDNLQSGIYIVQKRNKINKIYINKQ